jgi:hypothetical protein
MNEGVVINIIPELSPIQSLNLLVMHFEFVIPISNKNKIKILKNNIIEDVSTQQESFWVWMINNF